MRTNLFIKIKKTTYFLALAFSILFHIQAEAAEKPTEVILRLHGSNTIGAKMAPALAVGLFKERFGATDVTIQPEGPNEIDVIAEMPNKKFAIEIHAHGSSTGFKDMEAGKCDIAMASRPIKDKEVKKLSFLGDMRSLFSEHIVALDGVAVIVNRSNPIETISMSEIQTIFSGKAKNWGKINNGISGPVEVYSRDNKSGTYDTFKHLVLGKKIAMTPDAKRYESNSKLSDAVARNSKAIGFTGLPYILRSKALSVSDGQAAPIKPNIHSVATEDYALSRRLYLYTSPYPENVYVGFFVDFALSTAGQKIVEEVGFVDQNLKTFVSTIDTNIPSQNPNVVKTLVELSKDSERLSINFRFHPGTFILDERGKRDIMRLSSFLKKKNEYKTVLFVGFTDTLGDYNKNYELGMKRAAFVRDQLKILGSTNSFIVESGGEELPVASNKTEAGRNKNRRVEVWLKK